MLRAARFWLLLAVFGLAANTQAQESAEAGRNALLLARIRSHMAETLRRQPDYTCVQTVERSQRPARSSRFEVVDTLRLEVALIGGKELFSWPGAGRFEDKELRQIVGRGTTSTGSFGRRPDSQLLERGA